MEYSLWVVEHCNRCELDWYRSLVTQVQLDTLHEHLNVPNTISIRALGRNGLPRDAREELNEIPFLLVALKCGVRLLFASFMRRLLSELPSHPFQVLSSLWENSLALCMMWYRVHGRDPTFEELQCCFRMRCQTNRSGTYFPYSKGNIVIRKEICSKQWTSKWFFLGGPWEVSTYGMASVQDYMPWVFCIPSQPQNYSNGTLAIRRAIKATFNLKVNTWPSDFINEPNLKTFGLAPVDEKEASSALAAAAPAIVGSLVLAAKGGMVRLSFVAVVPPSVALPKPLAPTRTAPAPRGSLRASPRSQSLTLSFIYVVSFPQLLLDLFLLHSDFLFLCYFMVNPNIAAILSGVGSHCQQGIGVGAHKALWKGVEDSPQCTSIVIAVVKETLPSSSMAPASQALLEVGPNINPRSQAKA